MAGLVHFWYLPGTPGSSHGPHRSQGTWSEIQRTKTPIHTRCLPVMACVSYLHHLASPVCVPDPRRVQTGREGFRAPKLGRERCGLGWPWMSLMPHAHYIWLASWLAGCVGIAGAFTATDCLAHCHNKTPPASKSSRFAIQPCREMCTVILPFCLNCSTLSAAFPSLTRLSRSDHARHASYFSESSPPSPSSIHSLVLTFSVCSLAAWCCNLVSSLFFHPAHFFRHPSWSFSLLSRLSLAATNADELATATHSSQELGSGRRSDRSFKHHSVDMRTRSG
ncbi:hypothetical protein BD289DRAFT_114632 [Coniella lustricola]|uniref:Uncharacterized protein n=1 Tax=Coniella lustricola TaxID=2025994 RepID=A0A2T2ZX36_9PEZI|nr:hypothetical protein BD289DRAFT_114632 [Coniella lustricola]